MPQIIHIGYPKTATTWFQKSIFPNILNFRFIPKKEIQKYLVSSTKAEFQKFLINFQKDITESNIILSDEDYITNKPEHITPDEKAKRLQQLLPEAQIILFIRNQPDILASAYSQYIKAGGTLKSGLYIETLIQSEKLSHWQYDKIITLYQNIFGKNAVNVFLYEEINQPDFLNQFIQKYNFQLPENFKADRILNKSLCKCILSQTRFFNHFTKRQLYSKYPPKIYYFHVPLLFTTSRFYMKFFSAIFCFSKYSYAQKIFGDKEFNLIKDFFKESNQKLFNEFIIKDISKYNYPI